MVESRRFDVKVCTSLPREYIEFLRNMVERGETVSVSLSMGFVERLGGDEV